MSVEELSELLVFRNLETGIVFCFVLSLVKWYHANSTTWGKKMVEITNVEVIHSVLGLYGQISFTGRVDSQ